MFLCLNLLAGLIDPIPTTISYDKKKANLGKKLFFDVRFSNGNTISCASCHNLHNYGVDSARYSTGVGGKPPVNTPSVYNAVYNIAQFWDGRAKDLKEQSIHSITNPLEMDTSLKEIVKKLSRDKKIVYEFGKIYKDGLTENNILDALASFESVLITPNSRFDKYLNGDEEALSKKEKQGFELFQSHGCVSCHNGINIGGNLFQKFGILESMDFELNVTGRYAVTKDLDDLYFFKVPSLRNVAKTAPYFHTGATTDLKEAIGVMAKYQLGQTLSNDETDKIYAFLLSLTGELPAILKENE